MPGETASIYLSAQLDLSCQQLYCNLLSLYKLIIIISLILFDNFFTFSIRIMFTLIPSDANDPQGLMRR